MAPKEQIEASMKRVDELQELIEKAEQRLQVVEEKYDEAPIEPLARLDAMAQRVVELDAIRRLQEEQNSLLMDALKEYQK